VAEAVIIILLAAYCSSEDHEHKCRCNFATLYSNECNEQMVWLLLVMIIV